MSGCAAWERPVPEAENVTVVANDRLAENVGLMVLRAPRVAASACPGQFVHLRVTRGADFILRRPFSVHLVAGDDIQILYQVLGRGTREMSLKQRGDEMDVIGPLGTGFSLLRGTARALLVAGGLGAAPLGMLAMRLAEQGVAQTVAVGVTTRDRLVATDVFEAFARKVVVSTDDGSAGRKGFVTLTAQDLMARERPEIVYACGPEKMARSVAALAHEAGIPCQVSLERLMGCGVGACLSCVVSTTRGRKRACADGPVFDAEEVLWDEHEIPPRH